MISVCIPYYSGMKNGDFFLRRAIDSVLAQSFKDYEIVLTNKGSMPVNTNSAIKKAKGDIIKILYQDDYLFHPNSLQEIADNFKGGWLVTGCNHDNGQRIFNDHTPVWTHDVPRGSNTIGSPSVLAFENKNPDLFDERLSWLLDCELYGRLFKRYGLPTFLNTMNVTIGIGDHQMTNILTDQQKQDEVNYFNTK